MHTRNAFGLALFATALGAVGAAQAQEISLISRESILSGNFLVGYATLGDSGSDLQTFTTPDLSFVHSAEDSGGVNGLWGGLPVVGSGLYEISQRSESGPLEITVEGTAFTMLSTPYGYVSAGANALSQLDFLFDLPVPMNFGLYLQMIELPGATVNGLTARADALFKLSGPGDTWLFTDAGDFVQTGVLPAGQWRINGFADTRGNGEASFLATILLSPVPEPGTALMLALGLAGLVGWRKGLPARAP